MRQIFFISIKKSRGTVEHKLWLLLSKIICYNFEVKLTKGNELVYRWLFHFVIHFKKMLNSPFYVLRDEAYTSVLERTFEILASIKYKNFANIFPGY